MRQQLTDSVYVAIPRPDNKRKWMAQTAAVQGVLKRLELGLLLVSLSPRHPPVEVILQPIPATRRGANAPSGLCWRRLPGAAGISSRAEAAGKNW